MQFLQYSNYLPLHEAMVWQRYDVFVILDPCHMFKLARNALASLSSFTDSNGEKVKWIFFQNLNTLQEEEGLKLGNKLSSKHLQFEKHKMNARLAAQTLSSSVADAIAFLEYINETTWLSRQRRDSKFCKNNWSAIWHLEFKKSNGKRV